MNQLMVGGPPRLLHHFQALCLLQIPSLTPPIQYNSDTPWSSVILFFFFTLLAIGSSSSRIARVAASSPKCSSSATANFWAVRRDLGSSPLCTQPLPSVPPAAANKRRLHLTPLPVQCLSWHRWWSCPLAFGWISHPRHWGMGRTRVPNVCQHPQHQPSPLLHLPVHHIFSFCLLSLEGIWVEGVWRGVVLFAPPVLWWDEKWRGHPFFPLL